MRFAHGVIGKDLTVNNITDYIHDRKLLLSSPGGSLFEGWAIHDFLKGKVDEIGIVGVCASAATIILLAADTRWATPNARILIHNPYTVIEGDAKQVQQVANDLQIEQTILLNRYVERTGVTPERLQTIMNKSIYLTPQEAMNINLISSIKPQIDNNMEAKEKMNIFQKGIRSVATMLGISNMVVSDVNGNELEFESEVTSIGQLKVGSMVTANGAPAQGTYTLSDGTVIECENGAIVEISKAPATEETPNDKKTDMEAKAKINVLNQEIEKLKGEKLAVEKEFAEFKAKTTGDFMALQNDFNSFKNEFSKSPVIANAPAKVEPQVKTIRKSFNLK